jgi:hypothetical protein
LFFVATGVMWVGYTVLSYSLSQIRGCNAGFLAMAWPGKTPPKCNPDSGGTGVQDTTNDGGTAKVAPESPSPGARQVGTGNGPAKAGKGAGG